MGSEIIIPGTPLDQIPRADRPVFDPRLQNGFNGAFGNIAAPGAGSSVQRFSFFAQNITFNGNQPQASASAGAALAAGATSTLAAFVPSYTGPSPCQALITDETPVTTNPSHLQVNPNGGPSFTGTIILPKADPAKIVINNLDTVPHTYGVLLTPYRSTLRPLAQNAQILPLAGFGVTIGPTDLLRVRRLAIAIDGQGDFARFAPRAFALISGAQSNPPTFAFGGTVIPLDGSSDQIPSQQSPVAFSQVYSMRHQTDILGTDFNSIGASQSPQLFFLIYSDSSVSPLSSTIWALFDYYPGAAA